MCARACLQSLDQGKIRNNNFFLKKNSDTVIIWVSSDNFSWVLSFFLVCVLSMREIPRHVLLYIIMVSDLHLTPATV